MAWSTVKANQPNGLTSSMINHSCVYVATRFYTFGGLLPEGPTQKMFMADTIQMCQLLTSCAAGLGQWTNISASGMTPSARHGHSMGKLGPAKILLIGGSCDLDCENISNEIWQLNTALKSWAKPRLAGEQIPPLAFHRSVTVGTNIWIFGGLTPAGPVNDLYCINTNRMYCTKVVVTGDIPSPRAQHALVGIGDKLFAFGGYNGSTLFNDTYMFNTATSVWTRCPDGGCPPCPRANHACDAVGNVLYVSGGRSDSGILGDLYGYDTGTNQWAFYPERSGPSPREGHVLVNNGSAALVSIGGPEAWILWQLNVAQLEPVGEYNKKSDGWAVNHYANGSWYEGLWRDAKWKRGSWHHKTDIYEGEWGWNETAKVHEMQGWGVQRKTQVDSEHGATTTVYEGEWDRDKWHGSGTWRSPDGSGDTYHGTFDHGKRSGNGSMLFGGDGDNNQVGGSYVGEWKGDMFHGRGVRLWANGDRYEGQWVCGKENGEGTKAWSRDGSSFTGLWEMGVPKKGTRRWPNGDMFEGTFTPQPQQSGRGNDGGWACCGEGIATLSASSEGNSLLPLKGILNNNKFQQKGDDSGGIRAVTIVMGLNQQSEGIRKELEARFKEEINSAKNVWEEEVGRLLKEEIARSKMEWEVRCYFSSTSAKHHFHTKQVTKRNHQQHGDEINQLNQKIQQQREQLEGKGSSVLIPTNVGTQDDGEGKAVLELNQAMKLTTRFQALLKKSAPEFILLRESLTKISKLLQGATKCNEALRLHLRDLNELKYILEKQLDETCETSKRVLGQTLTVQNSEAEIQQCSRNISELTKKVLASKNPAATEGENVVIPPTKGNELLIVTLSEPLVLDKISEDFHLDAGSLPQPFQWLGSLSDTLGELQGCRFEECTKLADQNTMLSKELSEQITVGLNLHKEIEEIKGVCTMMTQEHKTKWMLRRGLEGDEQFIALPAVWSMLSELLPQAQQAVMDLMVSKAASMAAVVSTPSMIVTTSTLPGCTTAGVTAAPTTIVNKLCIECDENTANVQFQPCGHIVLCSQCAAVGMRKCLVCRTPIHQKNLL
ncbi:cell end marker Tea1 [Pelomyxa schiedti]|nr:cell end marker Tea1 [Pelomyxa schiedti]